MTISADPNKVPGRNTSDKTERRALVGTAVRGAAGRTRGSVSGGRPRSGGLRSGRSSEDEPEARVSLDRLRLVDDRVEPVGLTGLGVGDERGQDPVQELLVHEAVGEV